jgi:hypothetical protein
MPVLTGLKKTTSDQQAKHLPKNQEKPKFQSGEILSEKEKQLYALLRSYYRQNLDLLEELRRMEDLLRVQKIENELLLIQNEDIRKHLEGRRIMFLVICIFGIIMAFRILVETVDARIDSSILSLLILIVILTFVGVLLGVVNQDYFERLTASVVDILNFMVGNKDASRTPLPPPQTNPPEQEESKK